MAASSYSRGISSIKPLSNQTDSDTLTALYNKIIPSRVSESPNSRYIR